MTTNGQKPASRRRLGRLILIGVAAVFLIGSMANWDASPSVKGHPLNQLRLTWEQNRRALDECRRFWDDQRRAWDERRRAEEQAHREAKESASPK